MTVRLPGPVREEFALRLGQIARRWRARLDARLAPLGLTQAKWTVLVHLARGGEGMRQRDLAAFIGIEGPTLVRLLDALEVRGLVERHATGADRRANTVHLSPSARAVLRDIDGAAAALRAEILEGISPDELRLCLDVFARIERNIAAGRDGRP